MPRNNSSLWLGFLGVLTSLGVTSQGCSDDAWFIGHPEDKCKDIVCKEDKCKDIVCKTGSCVDGICQGEAGLGEECNKDILCREGECIDGICQEEGCDSTTNPCPIGWKCDDETHLCIKIPSLGDACENDTDCPSPLKCRNDRCVDLTIPVCGVCNDELLFCDEDDDLYCLGEICRKPTGPGEYCDECHICKDALHICIEDQCVPSVGSCQSDSDCHRDSYCCLDPECVYIGVCIPYSTGDIDASCAVNLEIDLFDATVQCAWTGSEPGTPYPRHTQVLSTAFVSPMPHEGMGTSNAIVFIAYNNNDGGTDSSEGTNLDYYGVIRIIHGETCALMESIFDADNRIVGGSNLAIADVDGDGWPEIFASRAAAQTDGNPSFGVVAFRWDDTQKKYVTWWRSSAEATIRHGGPAVHIIDEDGTPVVIGRSGNVFNALTGERINPSQEIEPSEGRYFAVVADLDGDGTIEYLAGESVYRWNSATKLWDLAYSDLPITGPNYAYADFGTRHADGTFDLDTMDGIAEIVSCGGTATTGAVKVVTLQGETIMEVTGMDRGGPCTIGDFDADGLPEVAVAFGNGFRVFDPKCIAGIDGCLADGIRWHQDVQDVSSGSTGASLFDFDGDGQMEAVYADECFLRVYDGKTGNVAFSTPRTSFTWYEMPVIADVDNDQSAEIIIGNNNARACPQIDSTHRGLRCLENSDCLSNNCVGGFCRCDNDDECNATAPKDYECTTALVGDTEGGKVCRAFHAPGLSMRGIRVLRDRYDRWVSSRNIWNQHTYSITNINDDMTLPNLNDWIQNHTVSGLNNYRQNVQGFTPSGAAPDITARFVGSICEKIDGDFTLGAVVCNRGTKTAGSLLPATFYATNAVGDLSPLCTAYTTANLHSGECVFVSCVIDDEYEGEIVLIANEDSEGGHTTVECNYDNNSDYSEILECKTH